jgi:putative toxin-antitoxin system antitoxin component (TIGR02293 family)
MAEIEVDGGELLNRILGLSKSPPERGRRSALAEATEVAGPAPLRTETVVGRLLEGLPVTSFQVLCEALQIPRDRLAELVGIAPRTLARRKVFKPDESERIFRFGRIFQDALELFNGEAEEARTWLKRPQFGLGGAVPLEFARTEPGAQEVRALIGRLNEGVFA